MQEHMWSFYFPLPVFFIPHPFFLICDKIESEQGDLHARGRHHHQKTR
jgi:hypothetical protein